MARPRSRLYYRVRGTTSSHALGGPLPSQAHWWKLDEASGSRVDVYGTNLTQTGTVTSTTGKFGDGALFSVDADNNYLVTSVNDLGLAAGPSWTVSAWVKMPAAASGLVYPFGEGRSSGNAWWAFLNQGATSAGLTIGGSTSVSVTVTLTSSEWFLLTVWRELTTGDAGQLRLNILKASDKSESTTAYTAQSSQSLTEKFSVGARSDGTGRAYNFVVDNLRWWCGIVPKYDVFRMQAV